MPKSGYRKNIISVRCSIGSSSLVVQALSVCSSVLKPIISLFLNAMSVSSLLHLSDDYVIIHYQHYSVAFFSANDS